MKVLFVCQRNNGRSQIAKGIYNKLTNSNDADSAGVDVDKHGQLLKERAKEQGSDVSKVIDVMREIGIDVSSSQRKQLNSNSLDMYDKVVVILESSKVSEKLKTDPKVEVWDIKDPKTKDLVGVRETRNLIEQKVKGLISKS